MLSKEQIEQIVQATIAQMNNQQTASASAPAGACGAGNGWMFDLTDLSPMWRSQTGWKRYT